MEPYEQRELGGVGEELWAIENTQLLTQLQLGSKLPSFRNPLPLERVIYPIGRLARNACANVPSSR